MKEMEIDGLLLADLLKKNDAIQNREYIEQLVYSGKARVWGIQQNEDGDYMRTTEKNPDYPDLVSDFYVIRVTPLNAAQSLGKPLLATFNVMESEDQMLFEGITKLLETYPEMKMTKDNRKIIARLPEDIPNENLNIGEQLRFYNVSTTFDRFIWIKSLNGGKGGYQTVTASDGITKVNATTRNLGLRAIRESKSLDAVIGREIRGLQKHRVGSQKAAGEAPTENEE